LEGNSQEFYNNKHSSRGIWNEFAFYRRIHHNILETIKNVAQFVREISRYISHRYISHFIGVQITTCELYVPIKLLSHNLIYYWEILYPTSYLITSKPQSSCITISRCRSLIKKGINKE
jgi:hypothetical protein